MPEESLLVDRILMIFLQGSLARMAAENRRAIIDQRIPMIEGLRARASNSTDR